MSLSYRTLARHIRLAYCAAVDELSGLRSSYPEWDVKIVSQERSSGPPWIRYTACRWHVRLISRTADELRRAIEHAGRESRNG